MSRAVGAGTIHGPWSAGAAKVRTVGMPLIYDLAA
jgi:hypothetical protein